MHRYNFVDSLLPFRKKSKTLHKLNLYQFLMQRYGIGSGLSKFIINHSGYSCSIKAYNVPSNYISNKVRKFFIRSISMLDSNLKEYMVKRIDSFVKMGSYKGVRHVFGYPCRGQRTRSNANTRSKMTYKMN